MRGKRVDQPALLQRLDAVDQIGGHDEAAALLEHLGPAVDRHFEAAFGDIACLDMRMRMRRTNGAAFEGHFHHHHLGQIGHDAPDDAGLRIDPFGAFGRYEQIA